MPRGTFLAVEMLAAYHGDCLWVEYGRNEEVHRLLIDGGPIATWPVLAERISTMPLGDRAFELVVLTHVDADHVEGLVRLFAEKPLPISIERVWFNGWRQMNKAHGLLGPAQGEFLSALLVNRSARAWDPEGPAVLVTTKGALPTVPLPGGMRLTLLSPTPEKLKLMAETWKKAVIKAGISPGNLEDAWTALATRKQLLPSKGLLGVSDELDALLKKQLRPDNARANGSSIAFLAEYAGKSVLFLADAHPGVIAASLGRLCRQRGVGRLCVDAVKVAHHGSKGNTTKGLLDCVDSRRFLISTNGDQFDHPDRECIAQILRAAPGSTIYFNYESRFTKRWLEDSRQQRLGYKAVGPRSSGGGLKISL